MGLTVTRKVGETIQLDISPGTTAQDLWEALQEGITIRVVHSQTTRAELDITTTKLLQISRPEQHQTMGEQHRGEVFSST